MDRGKHLQHSDTPQFFWSSTTLSQLATGDNHQETMPGFHRDVPLFFERRRGHFGWFLLCGFGIDLIDRVETVDAQKRVIRQLADLAVFSKILLGIRGIPISRLLMPLGRCRDAEDCATIARLGLCPNFQQRPAFANHDEGWPPFAATIMRLSTKSWCHQRERLLLAAFLVIMLR